MRNFLEVVNGRYSGTTKSIGGGESVIVGSAVGADLLLPNDPLLKPLHFILKESNGQTVLENLSGGLFVNNRPFAGDKLKHGDWIVAGSTLFQFTNEVNKTDGETVIGTLLARLRSYSALSLLADESLDHQLMPILSEYGCEFKELKVGRPKLENLTSNPIAIELGGDGALVETILRTFWGNGRLVFFERDIKWDDVCELVCSLLERTRFTFTDSLPFYDPRVLRAMFGEIEFEQMEPFFAFSKAYLVESQLPSHLFEFRQQNGRLNADLINLADH